MRRRLVSVAVAAWIVVLVATAGPATGDHSRSTGSNCANFTFQEEAQDYFNAHPGDPEGLDGPPGPTPDGVPNVACEHLPRRSVTPTTTSAAAPATTRATTTPTTTAATTATTAGMPTTGGETERLAVLAVTVSLFGLAAVIAGSGRPRLRMD